MEGSLSAACKESRLMSSWMTESGYLVLGKFMPAMKLDIFPHNSEGRHLEGREVEVELTTLLHSLFISGGV